MRRDTTFTIALAGASWGRWAFEAQSLERSPSSDPDHPHSALRSPGCVGRSAVAVQNAVKVPCPPSSARRPRDPPGAVVPPTMPARSVAVCEAEATPPRARTRGPGSAPPRRPRRGDRSAERRRERGARGAWRRDPVGGAEVEAAGAADQRGSWTRAAPRGEISRRPASRRDAGTLDVSPGPWGISPGDDRAARVPPARAARRRESHRRPRRCSPASGPGSPRGGRRASTRGGTWQLETSGGQRRLALQPGRARTAVLVQGRSQREPVS